MSANQRPKTASYISRSVRPTRCNDIGIGITKPLRRPASAKEWFEYCNKKRNEEALRQSDLEDTVNLMKKREWQTKIFNLLAEPKFSESKLLEWKAQEEKAVLLSEKKKRLTKLFQEDGLIYKAEREKKEKERAQTKKYSPFYPEVEIMKSRLQELKQKNEEERKKMSEKLNYESWRKNNMEVRQMESDRLKRYVEEAWVDQKQWKEDEKERQAEEERKHEEELTEQRLKEEENERKRNEEEHKKLLEWRCQLDAQIKALKTKEEEEIGMTVQQEELGKERRRLEEMIHKRDRVQETRKRKELELFWARQFQLKLKKKANIIQSELQEDEKILEELLRSYPTLKDEEETKSSRMDEAKWMRHVLEEQKKLEGMREKEYDLLFSEEAEKMWHQREADWQREQKARDRLMQEVMKGLEGQIEEKISLMHRDIDQKRNEKKELISSIEELQNVIEEQSMRRTEDGLSPNVPKREAVHWKEAKETRVENALRQQQIEQHRKEIGRLEEEMRRLWDGSYIPPSELITNVASSKSAQ